MTVVHDLGDTLFIFLEGVLTFPREFAANLFIVVAQREHSLDQLVGLKDSFVVSNDFCLTVIFSCNGDDFDCFHFFLDLLFFGFVLEFIALLDYL